MKPFVRKLKWFVQRRGKEAELRAELQFHLDEEAEERRAEGFKEEEAKWAARRDLGNVTLLQENTRTAWGWTLLEQFGPDLRYALRTMAANKGFCTIAILSLALGIGANTAIYSFMDSILLRSLPVSDPGALVVLNWHAQAPHFTLRGESSSVVHGIHGTTYDDPKSGTEAGIFPFPALNFSKRTTRSY